MNETDLKTKLRGILEKHWGREAAITSRELCALTGADDRRLRLAIRDLIAEGLPVLSSSTPPWGYFLPASREELDGCLASLKSRLIEDAKRRRDLKIHGGDWLIPARQGRLI